MMALLFISEKRNCVHACVCVLNVAHVCVSGKEVSLFCRKQAGMRSERACQGAPEASIWKWTQSTDTKQKSLIVNTRITMTRRGCVKSDEVRVWRITDVNKNVVRFRE